MMSKSLTLSILPRLAKTITFNRVISANVAHSIHSDSTLHSKDGDKSNDEDGEGQTLGEFPSDVEDEKKRRKEENDARRDQSKHSFRPKIDPHETSVLLFPGQGSQFVGMVKSLLPYPNVKEMFQYASDILGYNLLDVCLFGPKDKLDKTIHCQPAVMVTSLAFVEKLREENPMAIESCVAVAGFSVGEISALTFAGALSFEEAMELVKVRARAMQEAAELEPGGMMTCLLHPSHKLKEAMLTTRKHLKDHLGYERPVCSVANYLYPECKVVAGHMAAIDFLEKNKGMFGIRRTKRLPVSGAFHTDLMQPAMPAIRKAMKEVEFGEPIISVHSNVTSHRYSNKDSFGKLLSKQVVQPVKWEQIMHVLLQRPSGEKFPLIYEMGPGQQLGAILRHLNLKAHSTYTPVDSS